MSALAASSALRRALVAPASGVALSSSRLALCRSASRSVTTSVHFKAAGLPVGQLGTQTKNTEEDYMLSHAVYSQEEVNGVQITHLPPQTFSDRFALGAIGLLRGTFDALTGYDASKPFPAHKYLQRMIFLETVAGVPGMVGAMARHLRSLRTMRRDFGYIHTLLEEAENERMHLLTFVEMRKPGPLFRAAVLLTQGVFMNAYALAYVLSPKTCHKAVGYLEEEAVKTYTHCLHDLDGGHLPEWAGAPAPEIAKKYWRLGDKATIRDLMLAVRADEAVHRDVNHTISELPEGAKNPYA